MTAVEAPRQSRRMRAVGRARFTTSLLGASAVLLYLTLSLGPMARQVPLFVVVTLVGLLFFQLLQDLGRVFSRGPDSSASEETMDRPEASATRQARAGQVDEIEAKAQRFTLPWVLALPALAQLLGMLAGPGLFALLYLRVRAGARWRVALAGAVLTVLVLWVLFSVVLETVPGLSL
jgi:hypothetical protein